MAFKPSVTIHKSAKGILKVLACSEDADDAVKAFETCKDAGEVQLIVRGQLQKQRKIAGGQAPKKRTIKKDSE